VCYEIVVLHSDVDLFYPCASQNGLNSHEPCDDACLVAYTDIGYISDPPKACSQTGYVDILKVYETDLSCHFFESCKTHCPSRGHS